MGNPISKHRKCLWYWASVALLIVVLLVTSIGIIYPFTIPVFVAVAIAVYFNYIRKKQEEKELAADKPEEKERNVPEKIEVTHKIETPKKPEPTTVPTPPTPYFAHPYPLQKNFTGRLKERTQLTNWLDSDSHPVFVYAAIGGMGKSALAWYWLNEDILKRKSKPEGVIWWSFYDKEAGFESFLNHAVEYASGGETNPKDIASVRDKMDKFQSILSEKKFLLILDGVERILRAYAGMGSPYQGDEVKKDEKEDYKKCVDPNFERFLEMLAGIPKTKTLITTRICPEGLDELDGVNYIELKKMNKEDAVEFFIKQGVKGTRAEIEEVCCAHGYHPLCLRLLSGMIVKDMKYAGDIKAWTIHNPLPELVPKEHHILELAYDSLDGKKRALISKISAFRNPMDYDSLLIFNDFESEEKFNDVLIELTDRGLLFRDEKHNKFDLHPIVRKYCYDRLTDKEGVHSKLRDYFDAIPAPAKVESVDDLAAVIELYQKHMGKR
ncbi:hypothetical protein BEH94_05560 [Candidatus Altiarchaeales archaeon WOR_SM1_SCG]|nr:hypothetical protein BEH94_05560 [Candidatus Altiarchaeales archaeon WOR_SM1_SCG]